MDNKRAFNGGLRYFALFLAILFLVGGVLAWQGYRAYHDSVRYQREAARQAVQGGVNQVALLLTDLRDKVDMLAYAYADDIGRLIANPDNAVYHQAVDDYIDYFFPGHFAFTLSDSDGERLYHDDFGERVGELCRQDLKKFSEKNYRQLAYVHPGPQAYHVDIMVAIDTPNEPGKKILFVSFFPQIFADLLSDSEVAGHKLYLVREDQPDLIEIAAAGARDRLTRDSRLSAEEMAGIFSRQPVPGSRWLLVDIPSRQLFATERYRLARSAFLTGLVVLSLSAIGLVWLARREKALNLSEMRYQQLIDSVRAVAWQAKNNPPEFVFVSRRVESMLGYSPATFIKQPGLFFNLVHADDRARVEQIFNAAENNDTYGELEYRVRGKNGDWIWVRNIFSVRQDSHGQPRIDGLLIDVTERQRLQEELVERSEELTCALKELEAFSYSVSHDLRSPLRAIDGFACALDEEYKATLDATGRGYIARIRSASQRMGLLIDDLLQLARVGRKSLVSASIDITRLVKEVHTQIALEYPDRDVVLAVEPDIHMQGDPALLRMVIQNLLENAWKFTANVNDAKIEVGIENSQGQRCCCISDNGIGFDMAYAGKIFGAFQRLHSITDYPGTGIGLATVQRIIDRHGGRVFAEGKEGEGARFCFCLPDQRVGQAGRP